MKTRFAKQRLMKTLKAEEVNGKAYKPIEEARRQHRHLHRPNLQSATPPLRDPTPTAR